MSFQGSQDVGSPLQEARHRLGLSLADIASRLDCSQAAVSRYIGGTRTPPPALFVILGGASLARAHWAWLEASGKARRRRGVVELTLSTRLPKGMDIETARARCLAALAEITGEVGR